MTVVQGYEPLLFNVFFTIKFVANLPWLKRVQFILPEPEIAVSIVERRPVCVSREKWNKKSDNKAIRTTHRKEADSLECH